MDKAEEVGTSVAEAAKEATVRPATTAEAGVEAGNPQETEQGQEEEEPGLEEGDENEEDEEAADQGDSRQADRKEDDDEVPVLAFGHSYKDTIQVTRGHKQRKSLDEVPDLGLPRTVKFL